MAGVQHEPGGGGEYRAGTLTLTGEQITASVPLLARDARVEAEQFSNGTQCVLRVCAKCPREVSARGVCARRLLRTDALSQIGCEERLDPRPLRRREMVGTADTPHARRAPAVAVERGGHRRLGRVVVEGHAVTGRNIADRRDGEIAYMRARLAVMIEIHPAPTAYPLHGVFHVVGVEMQTRADLNRIARRCGRPAPLKPEDHRALGDVGEGNQSSLIVLNEDADEGPIGVENNAWRVRDVDMCGNDVFGRGRHGGGS